MTSCPSGGRRGEVEGKRREEKRRCHKNPLLTSFQAFPFTCRFGEIRPPPLLSFLSLSPFRFCTQKTRLEQNSCGSNARASPYHSSGVPLGLYFFFSLRCGLVFLFSFSPALVERFFVVGGIDVVSGGARGDRSGFFGRKDPPAHVCPFPNTKKRRVVAPSLVGSFFHARLSGSHRLFICHTAHGG